MGTLPVVARIAPHFGEEPCISGTRGSGTVFFSGCTMRCMYCQNYEISLTGKGVTLTPKQLAEGYKMLEESGVHNINLVTADHFVEAVVKSFEIYRPNLPIVYNCSGYTSPATLKLLDGLVDIYLPDFKYADDALAVKLSRAPDYVNTATAALKEMIFQVGAPRYDKEGMMKKGRDCAAVDFACPHAQQHCRAESFEAALRRADFGEPDVPVCALRQGKGRPKARQNHHAPRIRQGEARVVEPGFGRLYAGFVRGNGGFYSASGQ